MDIRNATKPAGTTPSRMATDTHAVAPGTPNFNEDGSFSTPPVDISGNIILTQYWNYLKDNGITKADLQAILDSLLTTGNVAWDFKLFDKIPVKFQVRTSWVDDYIIEKIDTNTAYSDKVSTMRYNNMVAELNLAASLRQYGENTFDVQDRKGLEKSLEFVKNLAYIFRNQLINKLAVFDRAVAVATSEWALKNFTTPLKDE